MVTAVAVAAPAGVRVTPAARATLHRAPDSSSQLATVKAAAAASCQGGVAAGPATASRAGPARRRRGRGGAIQRDQPAGPRRRAPRHRAPSSPAPTARPTRMRGVVSASKGARSPAAAPASGPRSEGDQAEGGDVQQAGDDRRSGGDGDRHTGAGQEPHAHQLAHLGREEMVGARATPAGCRTGGARCGATAGAGAGARPLPGRGRRPYRYPGRRPAGPGWSTARRGSPAGGRRRRGGPGPRRSAREKEEGEGQVAARTSAGTRVGHPGRPGQGGDAGHTRGSASRDARRHPGGAGREGAGDRMASFLDAPRGRRSSARARACPAGPPGY